MIIVTISDSRFRKSFLIRKSFLTRLPALENHSKFENPKKHIIPTKRILGALTPRRHHRNTDTSRAWRSYNPRPERHPSGGRRPSGGRGYPKKRSCRANVLNLNTLKGGATLKAAGRRTSEGRATLKKEAAGQTFTTKTHRRAEPP